LGGKTGQIGGLDLARAGKVGIMEKKLKDSEILVVIGPSMFGFTESEEAGVGFDG